MARKTRKSYGAELNKQVKEKELESSEEQEKSGPIALEAIEAPLWRRLAAYVIDVALGLFVMWLFRTFLLTEAETGKFSFLYMFSAIITIVWLFVLFPVEYSRGQTLGRKLFGLYTRDVKTKLPLKWWKYFIREYIYGVVVFLFTIPLECFFCLIQFIQKPSEPTYPLQSFTIGEKKINFAKDTFFSSETVYLPKKAKKSTNDVEVKS